MALNSFESRTGFGIQLPFTAREIFEALEVELNCNQLFGNHCRGLVGHCILIDDQLQLIHEDIYTECAWKSICTDDSLPLTKKNKFTVQDETVRTDPAGKVNVEITGLPISTDGVTLTITGSNWDWDWHRDLLMHWLSTAMLTELLKSWKQAHWKHCHLQHLHTAPSMTSHCSCWLQTVFCHWFCKL